MKTFFGMFITRLTLTSATSNAEFVGDIMFYVNLVLVLSALTEATALIVLYGKTSCAKPAALSAIIAFAVGLPLYIAQFVLYILDHPASVWLVYVCFGELYAAFVTAGVYCILLSRNSHRTLCLVTGMLGCIPPLGAILTAVLCYKIKRDTRGQKLVFHGYAYTYAALGELCCDEAEFIDQSTEPEFKPLGAKELKKQLAALKERAVTPAGQYNYALAMAYYEPFNSDKAVKQMNRSAEAMFAPAMFKLGYWYETGTFVKRDLERAKWYYTRAEGLLSPAAAVRSCIADIKSGKGEEGIKALSARAAKDDLYAKYDIAVCYETGTGVDKNIEKAVAVYTECANVGFIKAQKRIFTIAGKDMQSARNGAFFRMVTDREFNGTFDLVVRGLIELKKRRASDAADIFLSVVRKHDEWEGIARCLVGTLYIDKGKTPDDRINGLEYVKSAIPFIPEAQHIYDVVEKRSIRRY